ncbi:ASCH domain-containing protein [Aliarcobacter butzleri]|uniref:ASCH domain-containing protein n=1 Tax=Aliarcobacter butzleri TaxID=28197 RepID=UPI000659EF81|nr:ASCH domain-containing protein [Aliarcobacter butzleri]KLE06646.1 hypothetical protein AF78_02580 [Aliarcobacter butzleri L353]MCG3712136.1 ASCH domain-containing protein [Aliarcobacter butzleri]
MTILMSVKPKYVSKIISGEKKFEFRKKIFKKNIEKVYIYSSSPQKQIVGYFEIKHIIKDCPNKLWEMTKSKAGISKEDFDDYYKDRECGYAIEIKEFQELDEYLSPYDYYSNFKAPQSFSYFNQCVLDKIEYSNGK